MTILLQLVESSKRKGEAELLERREKVMIELDKIRRRAAEFAEYGELEMMVQYVNDVRAVQKRLADAQENINFINKVRPKNQIVGPLSTTCS